jgi:iron complex transport system ATP-binding protein
MTSVLSAQGLGKSYGRRWALSDCTLDVPAGRVVGLVGPNGAGKTTLLQLVSAHMHPTRGEVRLLGETLGAVDVFELRPRIGLTSAALAQRIAPGERTGDVVVSAGYAVVGR